MSLINREDAIKELMSWLPKLDRGLMHWTGVKAMLENLPDADDGWISCEERLPEENGEYLVTRESVFYRYIDIVRKSNCNSDLPMASDIKAWMPLPKPYEPKEKTK